jgi:hypothetical protein
MKSRDIFLHTFVDNSRHQQLHGAIENAVLLDSRGFRAKRRAGMDRASGNHLTRHRPQKTMA